MQRFEIHAFNLWVNLGSLSIKALKSMSFNNIVQRSIIQDQRLHLVLKVYSNISSVKSIL